MAATTIITPEDALPCDTRISDYKVVAVLGRRSALGVTYRAMDLQLGREVAIKEYFPRGCAFRRADGTILARDPAGQAIFDSGLKRTLQEARTLARFNHPNIVRIQRLIGDLNGTAYVVTDLVAGPTLEAVIEAEGPMAESRFVPILNQLLDGCAAIHGIDVVHGAIRPSNIILSPGDVPVLIDLRASHGTALTGESEFMPPLTDAYCPPEQYSRDQVQGPWSDIYALAATAYFALNGEQPAAAMARTDCDVMVPATEACRGQARHTLLSGLDWGLTLNARRRPRSIRDWRSTLDLAPTKAVEARPTVGLDRRALVMGGAGVAAVGAAAATAGWFALRQRRVLEDSAAPLTVSWSKDCGALGGDPWAAAAANADGVALVSHRLDKGGVKRLLAMRVDIQGNVTGEYVDPDDDGAAQAIRLTEDGGALIGGDVGGSPDGLRTAKIVRLNSNWRPLWSKTYGVGEVRSFIDGPGRLLAAIGTEASVGQAKLIGLASDGEASDVVSLLDRPNDSVERVHGMPGGGYAVLGRRTGRADGRNISQIWVSRLDSKYRELWRTFEDGLGTARGWALAIADKDLYVAGTTGDGSAGDQHLLLLRLDAESGAKRFSRAERQTPHGSGRALASVGAARPRLYLAGTAGWPGSDLVHARIQQVREDGSAAWTFMQAPQSGARVEGAVALAFRGPAEGYAVGYSFDGHKGARLIVSRLEGAS